MGLTAAAANTVVPALLALEALGFKVELRQESTVGGCRAIRDDEAYVAEDPLCVLGLVALVQHRGKDWQATDAEASTVLRRYGLDTGK